MLRAPLERARGRTVRELVVEIRRSQTAIAAGAPDTLEDESDATDGEPRTQVSILMPPRVAFLWRRALELARRMLGSQAPVWQAAEAIVAETMSAMPIEFGPAEFGPIELVANRRVTFFGPASVVALFRAGVRSLTEKGEAPWQGLCTR